MRKIIPIIFGIAIILLTSCKYQNGKSMKEQVNKFNEDKRDNVLFLHIREPEEIKRAVKEFNAKTILVTRNSVEQIMSNMADANVYNYEYDYTIHNDGTIEDLKKVAEQFVKDYIRGN